MLFAGGMIAPVASPLQQHSVKFLWPYLVNRDMDVLSRAFYDRFAALDRAMQRGTQVNSRTSGMDIETADTSELSKSDR
jgi:hypothetical protein